ncbi:MAG: phosphosulfolactate synthase [Acidimicrobiales bacterium]
MRKPDFLDLPTRQAKPRERGLTCVIDGGLPSGEVTDLLEGAAAYVDVWKFGWGSAYLDPRLGDKLALLAREGIRACPGGTLLEVAARQGRAEACLDWLAEAGFGAVEVSDGLGSLSVAAKAGLIRRAAQDFTVFAEVGAKDPGVRVDARTWADAARADLDAGATWVIAEGRESGTVGIFGPDGLVRENVVDALVEAAGPDHLIFEAPRREQQAWFIRTLGPDVNLANISPRELLGLEALRLGLRADTVAAAVALVPADTGRTCPT